MGPIMATSAGLWSLFHLLHTRAVSGLRADSAAWFGPSFSLGIGWDHPPGTEHGLEKGVLGLSRFSIGKVCPKCRLVANANIASL